MRRCLVACTAAVKLLRVSYFVRSGEIHCSYIRPIYRRAFSSVTTADILNEKIEDVQAGDLLNNLKLENSSSLTTTHVLSALNSLTEDVKNYPNYQPFEDARLQLVCSHLLKKIRFFELPEVIAILYSLVFLKVPADTVVMQSFLQIIRSNVNELSFGQIFWLSTILKKAPATPLVEALKLALPIVLHNHLDMQMDHSNPRMLAKLFSYAAHNKFSRDSLTKISLPLMKLSKQWTYNDAMLLLWGAVYLKSPFPDFSDLILTATGVLVENISEIPKDALMNLMQRLEKTNLLSEPLLKAVSKMARLEKWETKSIHDLLGLMKQISYLDFDLLETYAASLEKQFLSQDVTFALNIQEVVAVFARQNFVSRNMDFLLKEFLKQKDQINCIQSSLDLLVRFSLDLIILGAHPSAVGNLLNRSQDCLYNYPAITDQHHLKNIVLIKTIMGDSLKNEQVNMLASVGHKKLFNLACDIVQVKEFPLKLALDKGLEHQPYQINYNGIITKSGIYFDHLILNLKDPKCTIRESPSLKKLHIADELLTSDIIEKIAILVNSHENYAVNTNHHDGDTQLTNLALQKEGFLTLQICLNEWNQLLHQEQIPYLMRAIKKLSNNKPNTQANG